MGKTGMTLDIEISKSQEDRYLCLDRFLDYNCLVGPQERVPGLKNITLPKDISQFVGPESLLKPRVVFAHKIKISGLQEVETAFTKYLRQLCAQTEQTKDKNAQPIRAQIKERQV